MMVKDGEAALRDDPLTDFMLMLAERRGRSVLCMNSAIDFNCVEVARSAADDLDEAGSLTVLLNSPGGDIESAYRMLLALRDKAGDIEVLVPERAKSAAAFFCLGADSIHMGRYGELGPLDPQILDLSGSAIPVSSLATFNSLERLLDYSMESLDAIVQTLLSRAPMDIPQAIEQAQPLFAAIATPLYRQVDPHELGRSGSYLAVSEEYAMRVMKRWAYADSSDDAQRRIARRLVWEYPTHGFVIDLTEAREIGLRVERLDDESDMICKTILSMSEGSIEFQGYAPTADADSGSKREKENDDSTCDSASQANRPGCPPARQAR